MKISAWDRRRSLSGFHSHTPGTRTIVEDSDGELHESVIDVDELPAAGREPGSVLTIEYDDEVVNAEYDPEATERRSEAAQDRFDRLSRRPNDESYAN